MKKLMPKFVVKDMETLFIDETRQSINLLISNLESVPVTPRGQGVISRKKDSRGRSRLGLRLLFKLFIFCYFCFLSFVIYIKLKIFH